MRRGLEPHLRGERLQAVEILDPRLVMPVAPAAVERQLTGQIVSRVGRRGKYLMFELESGDVALHHLRMTGSFATAPAGAADPVTHVRARYHLADIVVHYRDPRRFGTLLVAPAHEARRYLDARLGPEPLSEQFTAAVLREALRGRRTSLKAALLDQRVVAGLGNIYVDEALFLARLRPQMQADRVGPAAAARLQEAIVERLREAIAVGGSTLRDYRGVEGDSGRMQERFLVYGKRDQPCPECGRRLRHGRVAGRGTTWCAHCQRRH